MSQHKKIPLLAAMILALLGLQAMEEHRIVEFPQEYVIPYL